MDKKPFSLIPAKAENTFLYIFNYVGDENDFELDKTAYNLALEKCFLMNATLAFPEYGISVKEHTITDAATKKVITLTTPKDISASSVGYPVIFYKGIAIPMIEIETFVKTTCVTTLVATTSTKYPSNTSTDWEVYYSSHLWALILSAELGGVTLPIETTSTKAVGHRTPVISINRRGTPEASGSITAIYDLTSVQFSDFSMKNNAGKELFNRIYGTDWTGYGSFDVRTKLTIPVNPFGIALITWTGKHRSGADIAATGNLWGAMINIYNCKLTGVSNLANISNDATDPITVTIEFKAHWPNPEYSTLLI